MPLPFTKAVFAKRVETGDLSGYRQQHGVMTVPRGSSS
jgi:hypothetical protein